MEGESEEVQCTKSIAFFTGAKCACKPCSLYPETRREVLFAGESLRSFYRTVLLNFCNDFVFEIITSEKDIIVYAVLPIDKLQRYLPGYEALTVHNLMKEIILSNPHPEFFRRVKNSPEEISQDRWKIIALGEQEDELDIPVVLSLKKSEYLAWLLDSYRKKKLEESQAKAKQQTLPLSTSQQPVVKTPVKRRSLCGCYSLVALLFALAVLAFALNIYFQAVEFLDIALDTIAWPLKEFFKKVNWINK